MGWLNFRIDAGLFQAIIHDVYDEARYSVLALRAARMATGSLRRPSMEVGGGISLSTLHPVHQYRADYILQSLYPAESPSKAS